MAILTSVRKKALHRMVKGVVCKGHEVDGGGYKTRRRIARIDGKTS